MADENASPPISFNQQLALLDIGGTVSTSKRVPVAEAMDILGVKARLRRSVNPAVSKARTRNSAEYRTDTGEFLTDDGHFIVVSAVTRVS